jgi:hypothetical protein
MTEQKQERQSAVSVLAAPGSRLEELLAAYSTEKAAAEEAASRFKAVTDALKAEISAMAPGAEDAIASGAANLPKLRLSWRRAWHFKTDAFKAENPYLYVKYSQQSGHWELRAQT